jgi:pimeloyl-ACP methyl ester carboxylesterase
MPSDWTYRQTAWMQFWGKFRRDPAAALNDREQAAVDCAAIKAANAAARTGTYWVTLASPERFKVMCDRDRDGGGWTLVYSFWNHEVGFNEWALNWDTVTVLGKRHNSPTAEGLAGWVKDPETTKKYVEAFQRSDFEAMLNYYKRNSPRRPYSEDKPPFVKAKMPVLMIHGLNDTALLAGALNNTWEYLAQDLTLVTIPGAAHFVQQDAADLVTRSIKMWLGR